MLVAARIALALLLATIANSQTVVYTDTIPFTMTGYADAAPGTPVRVFIGTAKAETQLQADKRWSVFWTAPLETG
ncbi:MAG TPA: hypothetical protein VF787_14210, partial [Thermoanaerobaculia bacterium]